MEKLKGSDGSTVFRFREGGICEERELYIIKDYKIDKSFHTCRHCKDGVNPLVVQVVNEGGYNSTLACVQCIVEAVTAIKENVVG